MLKKTFVFVLLIVLGLFCPGMAAASCPLCSNTDTLAASAPVMDVNDSILHFPAYDTYCHWDTCTIHPNQYSFWGIDSIGVVLNDPRYCGYAHPFHGNKSSDFGYRRGRGHYGVDINLETGDPVVAAFEGRVRIATRNKSYGNLVVIRHNNGLETLYAHLSKLNVGSGDHVDAGQVIGLGGNTGRSYGSHLHFEVRYRGIPLNPNNLISFEDKKLRTDTYTITLGDFGYLSDEAARRASMKKSNRYRGPVQAKYEDKIPQKLTAATPVKAPVKTAAPTASKAVAAKPGAPKPAASKATAPVKAGTRVHVVKKGDTLYKIARIYGTTTEKICKQNGITPSTTLSIGRKLKI